MTDRICSIEDCGNKVKTRGYCQKHYKRLLRHGDPLGGAAFRAPRGTQSECAVEGCDRRHYGKGYCQKHYRRVKATGDPSRTLMTRQAHCDVEDCDRPHSAKGYCSLHYRRVRDGLDDMRAEPLIAQQGSGTTNQHGYRVIRVNGDYVREHRHVMEQALGRPLFADENVHHINGDRADNRLENLELWSTSQPAGQRVEDKVEWAEMILTRYGRLGNTPTTRA